MTKKSEPHSVLRYFHGSPMLSAIERDYLSEYLSTISTDDRPKQKQKLCPQKHPSRGGPAKTNNSDNGRHLDVCTVQPTPRTRPGDKRMTTRMTTTNIHTHHTTVRDKSNRAGRRSPLQVCNLLTDRDGSRGDHRRHSDSAQLILVRMIKC